MPFTVEWPRESDVVIVRGVGDVGASAHRDMLAALTQACEARPSSRVVLDLSAVDHVPTAEEARALAQHVVAMAKAKCRVAVVGRSGAQYGVARMVETISSVRDVISAAFQSVDEALAWIRATPEVSP